MSVGVVVWEWEEKAGQFFPYAPRVSNAVERAFKRKQPSYNLRNVDKNLAKRCVYFKTRPMIQGPPDNRSFIEILLLGSKPKKKGRKREVRRTVYAETTPFGKSVSWQWVGDIPGEWFDYESRVQCLIDSRASKGEKIINIEQEISQVPYTVDIPNLRQRNNDTGYERAIRTLSLAEAYTLVKEAPTLPSGVAQLALIPRIPIRGEKKRRSALFLNWSFGKGKVQRPAVPAAPPNDDNIASIRRSHSSKSLNRMSTVIKVDPVSPPEDKSPEPAEKSPESAAGEISGVIEVVADVEPRTQTLPTRGKRSNRPPTPSSVVWENVRVAHKEESEGGSCSICMSDLSELDLGDFPAKLKTCEHSFHAKCLERMVASHLNTIQSAHFECPTCKTMYGVQTGNQPDGRMTTSITYRSLPGHPGYRTIVIIYHFQGGIQGPEHPHPGDEYTAEDFPRQCFLPDTDKGGKVLEMLKVAFDRRLIFTIGSSDSPEGMDTIKWTDILHKTEMADETGNGYPDPNFLDAVLSQLAAHGIKYDSRQTQV